MVPRLSVATIVLNEEANLGEWLRAVASFADEIVAVDAGSTDSTVEMLKAAGARVVVCPWQGYSAQRNRALELASGRWVVFLDADERPDTELAAELERLKGHEGPEAGFELGFKVFFFGKWLRFGGFFPEWHLRVCLRGRGRWEGDVHERLVVQGRVGRLKGYVHHYSYNSIDEYLERMIRYSTEAARQMLAQGRKVGPAGVVGHAAWAFFHRYILRLGMLDGYEGYLAARLEASYTLAKYAKLLEMIREGQ